MRFLPTFLRLLHCCGTPLFQETDGALQRGEEWRHVRCLCGSYVGRCRDHQPDIGERTVTYRLLKYAMRPIGPSVE